MELRRETRIEADLRGRLLDLVYVHVT